MPSIHLDLSHDGLPRINVMIRQQQGESYVQSSVLIAVVDNGASDVFAAPGILAPLGFKPTVPAALQMGSYSGQAWGCEAEIVVLNAGNDSAWMSFKVGEVPSMPFANCQLVVGMSFLRRCIFLLDGIHGKFTLAWSLPHV